MPLINLCKPSMWKQFFLYMKASKLVEKERYDEAKELIKDILRKKIYVTEAHYYLLGKVYLHEKDHETAIRCFITSIENNVYNNIGKANTYFYLGLSYYENGDFEKAATNFKKAIEMKKQLRIMKDTVMSISNLYRYLGSAYYNLGKKQEAILALKEGLILDPYNEAIKKELSEIED